MLVAAIAIGSLLHQAAPAPALSPRGPLGSSLVESVQEAAFGDLPGIREPGIELEDRVHFAQKAKR
jgi:hypothetical protein